MLFFVFVCNVSGCCRVLFSCVFVSLTALVVLMCSVVCWRGLFCVCSGLIFFFFLVMIRVLLMLCLVCLSIVSFALLVVLNCLLCIGVVCVAFALARFISVLCFCLASCAYDAFFVIVCTVLLYCYVFSVVDFWGWVCPFLLCSFYCFLLC